MPERARPGRKENVAAGVGAVGSSAKKALVAYRAVKVSEEVAPGAEGFSVNRRFGYIHQPVPQQG